MKRAAFTCSEDVECTSNGVQGTCEPIGHCSFPDPACASGKRYAELSGEQGGQCVGAELGIDAPVEPEDDAAVEPPVDAPPDTSEPPVDMSPEVCPGFTPTDGRYFKKLAAAGWTNQRSTCGTMPGNVFLAVPDDAAELASIVAFAGGDAWVGISDAADEADYVTVLGVRATFLPWATGEPDNAGNQDCVRTRGETAIETAMCGSPTIAVCECVP